MRIARPGRGVRDPGGGARIDNPGVAEALLFWLVQGAAILVKGPVVPMISLLTIAALGVADRNLRWLNAMKPVLGTLVARRGGAVVRGHFPGHRRRSLSARRSRATSCPSYWAHESHGGFPACIWHWRRTFFWPLAAGPRRSPPVGAQRGRLAFASAGLGGADLDHVELIPTKLPHYVLPAFPPWR